MPIPIVATQRVLLSESVARRLFGTRSAIGKRVAFDAEGGKPMEVVGVVHSVRFRSVETALLPAMYFLSGEDAHAPRLNTMLYVRATMPTPGVIALVRRTARELSTPLSIADARSLNHYVRAATLSTRFVAVLLVGFAASAVLLAVLGIYGVVSYIVSQRMREFGVRLVLGANGRDLLLATVRRSVWLTGGA